MEFQLPTYNKGWKLYFDFETGAKTKIGLSGYDEDSPGTYYFDREVEINGNRVVEVGLPVSPRSLVVNINNGNNWEYAGTPYSLNGIKYSKLRLGLNRFDRKTAEFIDFAIWFSCNAEQLELGEYSSKNGKFTIIYLPSIDHTPARIEKQTGVIEVSQSDFLQSSVPNRVFKLLHEYSHLHKNRRPEDEKESDTHAIRMFKKLGFPKVEAIYAITELDDNEYNWQRMNNVFNKL